MVDTRDKRGSAIGVGLAALLVLPAPGTLDQPDRQQVASCYRGISAAAAIVTPPADGPIAFPPRRAPVRAPIAARGAVTAAAAQLAASGRVAETTPTRDATPAVLPERPRLAARGAVTSGAATCQASADVETAAIVLARDDADWADLDAIDDVVRGDRAWW